MFIQNNKNDKEFFVKENIIFCAVALSKKIMNIHHFLFDKSKKNL